MIPGVTPLSADVGTETLVPSAYANYQFTDRFYVGLAMNAPFGLITTPDHNWAGSPVANTSKVFSLDFNPTVAYH